MHVERPHGEYTDLRIPGIIATPTGALIKYCECRRDRSDWASIDIKAWRSEDNGESWTEVLLITSNSCTMNNPVMIVGENSIVMLYCENYKRIFKRISTDDGKSFSAPTAVDIDGKAPYPYTVLAVGPGHGICHRGRLIVPIWFAYNPDDPKSHHPSFVSTLYSDDGGESFGIGEVLYKDELIEPSESALAITKEGEYLISIRLESEQRCRAIAKSKTGISDWRELRYEKRLPDPICMGSMTHHNGVIYHSNCHSTVGRKNLTLKISDDGFESFDSILISEAGGYSDIALLGDKVCVFYEKDLPETPFELYFDVISPNK